MTDPHAQARTADEGDAPAPRVVVIDLGGVAVRICLSWAEAARRAGLPEELPVAARAPESLGRRRSLHMAYQIGTIGCEDYFREIAHTTGGALTPSDIQRVHHAWIIEEYSGVHALVAELNDGGRLRTACLSNTNRSHWRAMLGEVPPLFAGAAARSEAVCALGIRLASQELGSAKPDPTIYRRAQAALDASGPEIVFFDDLAENIEAARAAGWRALQIDHQGDPAQQVRTYLRELGAA